MEPREAESRMRALTAIIQQMMEESYASDRASRRAIFKEMLENDDPVTMAIANVLTPGEMELAFRWVEGLDGTVKQEMEAMPVRVCLTEEQIDRVQARLEAESAAREAHDFAVELRAPKGYWIEVEERTRIGEEYFIEQMVDHAVEGMDVEVARAIDQSTEERIGGLREPWRTRAMVELEPLRERIRTTLAQSGSQDAIH